MKSQIISKEDRSVPQVLSQIIITDLTPLRTLDARFLPQTNFSLHSKPFIFSSLSFEIGQHLFLLKLLHLRLIKNLIIFL